MGKRLVLSACAFALLTASALAKPGVATTTVNLRAEANTSSGILAKIPGGARLDIGDCTEGWCAVTFQGKSGFAIQTALDASGRPRAVRRAPPPGYGPDDDFVPAGPGYGPYPVAPPGIVYAPGPYFYGPGPYWGGYGYRRWGGYGWRRW
jgi:SH3 domain-containing protein